MQHVLVAVRDKVKQNKLIHFGSEQGEKNNGAIKVGSRWKGDPNGNAEEIF